MPVVVGGVEVEAVVPVVDGVGVEAVVPVVPGVVSPVETVVPVVPVVVLAVVTVRENQNQISTNFSSCKKIPDSSNRIVLSVIIYTFQLTFNATLNYYLNSLRLWLLFSISSGGYINHNIIYRSKVFRHRYINWLIRVSDCCSSSLQEENNIGTCQQ